MTQQGATNGTAPKVVNQTGARRYELSQPAHTLTVEAVIEELDGHMYDGLSKNEALERSAICGINELPEQKPPSWMVLLAKQIGNSMTMILIVAMAASFFIGALPEGSFLAGVIATNIAVGFSMELNGQKKMQSLKSLGKQTISVIRDGESRAMETQDVVPGDLVELKVGDCVPADVRLIETFNLETKEMNITGEPMPVHKDTKVIADVDKEIGDRRNIAFHSTTVEKGRGRGIVVATGRNTSVAKFIMLDSESSKPLWKRLPSRIWDIFLRFLGIRADTPLHVKLSCLSLMLFVVALSFMTIVFGANDWNMTKEVVIYAISTGISMIPIALLVVLSITMAKGAKVMQKRNVIVRNMRSIESLGGVTDICSDKTGTLTMGQMTLRTAWVAGYGTYAIERDTETETDDLFNPSSGTVHFVAKEPRELEKNAAEPEGDVVPIPEEHLENPIASRFVTIASLSNMAQVHNEDQASSKWHSRGSPTEVALQVFACRFNQNRLRLVEGELAEWKQISEFEFSSDVKKMSIIMQRKDSGEQWLFCKGAVERVIDSCTTSFGAGGDLVETTDQMRADIVANAKAMADDGLRVLALASRTGFPAVDEGNAEALDRSHFETDLTFHGLVGIYDPPRATTKEAVRRCHRAQIRVRMLTGDHPDTARAIARQVGILPGDEAMRHVPADKADAMVMAARDFDALSDEQLDRLEQLPLVVARCSPLTKTRMVKALHRRKAWVAMTGDGVNDVSSLNEADVGIAMGVAGADVTKDVADIVLADDNFASILSAVMEGRRMFDNIQRFVLHVLAQNIGQAIALLVALVWRGDDGYTVFPLSPVEIMCVLLFTSGFPDMALGQQRIESDVPDRKPRDLKPSIFTSDLIISTFVYGFITGAVCLGGYSFVIFFMYGGNLGANCNREYSEQCISVFKARSTCFMIMTTVSLCLALEVMSLRRSFFRMLKKDEREHTVMQPLHDLWENKFLTLSVAVAFGFSVLSLYVPHMNTELFKHAPIGLEWAVVVVLLLVWFAFVEAYKFLLRRHHKKKELVNGPRDDLEARAFRDWVARDSVDTDTQAIETEAPAQSIAEKV